MDTVVFTDPKVVDFFTNEMLLAKINAEVDTLAKAEYRVSGYPTAVLIDRGGKEVDRLIGSEPAEEYIKTFVDYSNGIGTLADLLHQAETSEDRELYYNIATRYKYSGLPTEAESWFGRVIETGEPTDSLSGMSTLGIADMYRRAGEYDKSLAAFLAMANDFQGTTFEELADIYTAIVYEKKADTAIAIEAYQKFIDKYPESEDVEYAQEQIDKLQNAPEQVD